MTTTFADPQVKTCRVCQQEKPISAFVRYRRKCKACYHQQNEKYRTENKVRNQARRIGEDPYKTSETKECSKCHEKKSVKEFSRSTGTIDGLQSRCRKCASEAWQRCKYGEVIQPTDVCAICGQGAQDRRLVNDHDHGTGKRRGVLCDRCNCGIGFLNDPEILRKAAEYLESFRKPETP